MGDGINDAPAMHAADTSISVESAVDVARDAADFVLLEQDLDVVRRGITLGRTTFANTLKYIQTTLSANLGNMIAHGAAASLFLPFLPLLAGQILLNNFLSDIPAFGLAGDSVDPELVTRPRRWNVRELRRFMIQFGLLSSVFDLATFGVLLLVYRAAAVEFRTVPFVESLLTELAIALVVRTRDSFSAAGRSVLALVYGRHLRRGVRVAVFAARAVTRVHALPPVLVALIVAITIGYVVAAESVKRAFYRSDKQAPRGRRWPRNFAGTEPEIGLNARNRVGTLHDCSSDHEEPGCSDAARVLASEAGGAPGCHAEAARQTARARICAGRADAGADRHRRRSRSCGAGCDPLRPGTTRLRHRARNVGTRRRHPARARASHGQEHSPRRIEPARTGGRRRRRRGRACLEGQVIARLDNAEQKAAAVGAGSQLASAQLLGLRAEKAFMDILQAQRAEGRASEMPDPDELLEGKAGDAQLELLHTETEIARRAAALSLAQRLVARRLIRAPMAGVVLERNVAAGESLPASPPGPPLFVIGSIGDPAAGGGDRRTLRRQGHARHGDVHLPGLRGVQFSGTIRG